MKYRVSPKQQVSFGACGSAVFGCLAVFRLAHRPLTADDVFAALGYVALVAGFAYILHRGMKRLAQ